MWSSFTQDEKKLILFVLGLLALGMASVAFFQSRRQTEVFPAGRGAQHPAAVGSGRSASVGHAGLNDSGLEVSGIAGDGRIDLNLATIEALDTLPGIGPARAEGIVSYRDEHGGFRSVEELDKVPGIGPAAMAKLRPRVFVGQDADRTTGTSTQPAMYGIIGSRTIASPPPPPLSPPPGASALTGAVAHPALPAPVPSAINDSAPVNINTAGAETLATLKYVGPKLAQRIIEHRRHHGAFPTPESLQNVKGIGRRVLEANWGRIVVR